MIVEEPMNPMFKPPRASTVAEKEDNCVPQKFDFVEMLDRPVIKGRVKKKVWYSNGTVKNNRDVTPILEEVVQDSACIDTSFLRKHNFTTLSESKDFIDTLFL